MSTQITNLNSKSTPAKRTNGKQPAKDAKPTPAVEKSKPIEIPVCPKNSFKFRESCSNRYLVRLPLSVTLSQAENKAFMEQCLMIKSREFTSFDEVFCVGHEAGWATEWMVVYAEPGVLNLAYQRSHTFEQRQTVDPHSRQASSTELPSVSTAPNQ